MTPSAQDPPRSAVVGIDGCAAGWYAVALRPGAAPEGHLLARIGDLPLFVPDACVVAIDIPIGMPTGPESRQADTTARKALGERRSSVFRTPIREALEAGTYAQGNAISKARTGKGMSRQAFALRPKILEVDEWISKAPCPIFEIHPEVCFTQILGAPAKFYKKTASGAWERRQALQRAGIGLDRLLAQHFSRVHDDDILDAAAAAWSAARLRDGLALSFPDPPDIGPQGRLVAIWA